jgi:arylsulfatase A-like enzyme
VGAAIFSGVTAFSAVAAPAPPNVVIIFLDDSGWSDFRPFDEPTYPTPNVARLADEGRTFTNFYVPQAICSASRSALMTGCVPGRTKMFGAHPPGARGLDPSYMIMSEMLKPQGYATAVFGKWHLGDQPDTRPPARGFDESAGLMYSNDMWRFHPEKPKSLMKTPLKFWDNGEVTIEDMIPEDQTHLTTWYTEKAVDFIQRHHESPFFLYVPHSMPHVPLFCSEKFKGKSGAGLYGDVMMEIDWSVGQIMKALKDTGVEDNTLVIFTSDNGPWLSYGEHAGKTKFREGKGTTFDGGVRSACIMKMPGRLEAGTTSDRTLCTIDILPTVAHLTGAVLPANPIDGKNQWDLISGVVGTENPQVYYPLSNGRQFQALLSGDGRWKWHVPHAYRTLEGVEGHGKDGIPVKYNRAKIGPALFDMLNDPLETTNVMDQHPDVAARLQELATRHQEQFYSQK